MSTALAIAATTAVLRNILETGLTAANTGLELASPPVTVLPPDRLATGTGEVNRLNLFMYQVTPNPGWRNVGLPARNGNGDRLDDPPLALDLHYLLSAYGKEDLLADVLLGVGMHLLHNHPVLTRDRIRSALTAGAADALIQLLATARLDEQEELVKITPQTMTIEDISKLWSVFGEKYRPSAAFLATTVLIRGDARTAAGPPVQKVQIKTVTLRTPRIESVDPQAISLTAGASLTLRGLDLLAPDTFVRFGSGAQELPIVASSTPTALVVGVPGTLRAGVNTVQVIQQLRFDPEDTGQLHRGFESNVAAFVVRPSVKKRLEGGVAVDDVALTNHQVSPAGAHSGTITVKVTPDVGPSQRVALLLNEISPPADRAARNATFEAPARDPDADPTDTFAFAVRGLAGGGYLVRVRVDGAETDLVATAAGEYVSPRIDVP